MAPICKSPLVESLFHVQHQPAFWAFSTKFNFRLPSVSRRDWLTHRLRGICDCISIAACLRRHFGAYFTRIRKGFILDLSLTAEFGKRGRSSCTEGCRWKSNELSLPRVLARWSGLGPSLKGFFSNLFSCPVRVVHYRIRTRKHARHGLRLVCEKLPSCMKLTRTELEKDRSGIWVVTVKTNVRLF